MVALTILAALFRLPTLATQHYWVDEAVTVGLVHLDLGQMLRTIPATESTPPLYYIFAWVWARLFGSGEFGLRSLSALTGTAIVPATYAAARAFAPRCAALFAGLLAAVSPVLVWYSQEARAYALLVFLCVLGLLLFGRALRAPAPRRLALWSLVSVLALATHYFAGFLVLPEALWLLRRGRRRGAVTLACVPIVLAAGALVPLAVHQRQQGHLAFIRSTSLWSRTLDTAKVFAAGQTGPQIPGLPLVAICLAIPALVLLARASTAQRWRILPLAVVTAAGLAVPWVLALGGEDYIVARNLLPFWPALAILAATGLAAGRARWLGRIDAAALIAVSVGLCIAVPLTPELRREAINARLSSVPGQNATVDIVYVPVPSGQTKSAAATCPSGYRTRLGGIQRIGRSTGVARTGIHVRRLYARWAATVSNLTHHEVTYELTVVCAT